MFLTIEKLQQVQLLKHAPVSSLEELMKCLHARSFPCSSFIVSRNDIAKEMFFIVQGDVDIIDASGKVFAQGHAGEFFGELGLIYSIPRTASVRAATDVQLYILNKEDFDHLRSNVPAIEEEVTRLAMERLSRFQVELVRLSSIPENIAYTPDQLQVFLEVFYYWDRDHDNRLDKGDLTDLIQSLSGKKFTSNDSERILKMLDQDQDGFVSFDDFVKKIRILVWFLAPGQNKRIKETLAVEPLGVGQDEYFVWHLKSICVGIVIGMVSTVISVKVLSSYFN
jgi:CRP-like cAMP-binding protein